MYVNQTLFFQLRSVVLSWKTWILITCLGNECTAVTKRWLPNTNFNNSANWDKGRVPCVGDNVQLNQVIKPVTCSCVIFWQNVNVFWIILHHNLGVNFTPFLSPSRLITCQLTISPICNSIICTTFSVLNSVYFPLLPSTLLHTQDVSSMNTQF